MPFSVLLYDAQEPRETGGVQPLPRAGRGKSRGPAGRGLCNLDVVFCFALYTKRYKFVIPKPIGYRHCTCINQFS